MSRGRVKAMSHPNSSGSEEELVLVAVDGSKKITEYALNWALTNVVLHRGDKVLLLALVPGSSSSSSASSGSFMDSGWRKWGLPSLSGECASPSPSNQEELVDLHTRCSKMIEKLRKIHDLKKVHLSVDVVQSEEIGLVQSEARKMKSTWVILDRHLKRESKSCLEFLQCNIVLVNRSRSKILRLNLKRTRVTPDDDLSADSTSLLLNGLSLSMIPKGFDQLYWESFGSPETHSPTHFETPSSSFDRHRHREHLHQVETSDVSSPTLWKGLPSELLQSMTSVNQEGHQLSDLLSLNDRSFSGPQATTANTSNSHHQQLQYHRVIDRVSSVRKQMHLTKQASPQAPPPLCSVCQHKAPVFGKPPQKFTYSQLDLATEGFSGENFLAEGGFGSVHRGILPDGQVVAVKQHKLASSQGDKEFCSEVEVLSCAQQRNLVTLIGYCVEEEKRILVYEFVCNGSLDSHLYGRRSKFSTLKWTSRQKIAVGAARALRYLHEECRVGCIVHRDMRPNNILLTHDFEPMVGDFGLARWQPDGNRGVETRVIGAFGYLAPEYTQTGQVTEKADVYSFGIVLLELVTGRKAVDLSRTRGEMCLSEWARPLLRSHDYYSLVDHRLDGKFHPQEAESMLHTAALCIDHDPAVRPRMSQVLRLLEGDVIAPRSDSPQSVLSPRITRLSSFSSSISLRSSRSSRKSKRNDEHT